ncbi:MAG: VanZ family protein [Treponema sp.]|nr:VanZ family protein [Treponema sp.]
MKILLKIPALFIGAVIWFLSSQSILPQPKGILGFDKLQHLLAYLLLALAVSLWFSREKFRSGFWFPALTFIISSAYGAIDEVHQYFVPGRDCNVWDWLADASGAFLGMWAAVLAAALIKRKNR